MADVTALGPAGVRHEHCIYHLNRLGFCGAAFGAAIRIKTAK